MLIIRVMKDLKNDLNMLSRISVDSVIMSISRLYIFPSIVGFFSTRF